MWLKSQQVLRYFVKVFSVIKYIYIVSFCMFSYFLLFLLLLLLLFLFYFIFYYFIFQFWNVNYKWNCISVTLWRFSEDAISFLHIYNANKVLTEIEMPVLSKFLFDRTPFLFSFVDLLMFVWLKNYIYIYKYIKYFLSLLLWKHVLHIIWVFK